MKIETPEFILRSWKPDDAEGLAVIANNKKISDNLRDGFPHPYTLDDAKKYISGMLDAPVETIACAIEIDGKVAGSIGAFIKNDVYRKSAEIGYYLTEEYWGRGIITKAITEIVGYMFQNYDIVRIFAEPFACNTGSRKALEKSGFLLEGILRSSVIKNYIIKDSCMYSILRSEYEARLRL